MRFKKALTIPTILGIGLVFGTVVSTMTYAISNAASTYPNNPAPRFPKNVHGQTYGSIANVTSMSQYPDLVLVQATNGKVGYVYAHQLDGGPMPKTPQQAIAMNPKGPRIIPVYAVNGMTVIGHFVIGGGTVTTSNR
ncbi:MAG: peptidase M56 BlaR1 [Sulfobacillus thermosulfidooxidans]|uniref:Peptidase M56 BlaR1 n=1 Tax=Sulfobacillus thermosulfidooxidans TaxID=28034 RepID=A0A2T2WTA0_SULTH|nr:MAG: peptidase M56 BlaR1 [Sulfobacillus thermosulfidooxidans]